MEKYSEYIMRTLRARRGLEENDESQDEDIMTMSKSEAFQEVLYWEGIIGYDYKLKKWINDIYGIDLDE